MKAEKKKLLMYEVKFTLDEQVRRFNSRKVDEGVLSDKEIALNKASRPHRNPNPNPDPNSQLDPNLTLTALASYCHSCFLSINSV